MKSAREAFHNIVSLVTFAFAFALFLFGDVEKAIFFMLVSINLNQLRIP